MAVLGVWMWPESIRIEGAKSVIARCRRLGVTDIFFLTKGLAGTTSYPTALAPAYCDRDLLGELLDAAHASDIRVHAWFTSASDAHYKDLHPESGRFHITRGRDKSLISLTDEGYISTMQRIIGELCRNYPIDGLHLDYIRYNHLLYGWSEEDCARYAKEGADITHLRMLMDRTFLRGEQSQPDCIFDAFRACDASVHALARTRRKDVVRFAKTMIASAKAEKPNLIISAALMPEGAYSDTAFSDLHYGQNYEDAASLYDYALPMAYSQAYCKNGAWVREVAQGSMRRGLKTIVGLHAYEGGTGISLASDIAALKDTHADGMCLFRYGAFASAHADAGKLLIHNPLQTPITTLCWQKDAETFTTDVQISSGTEARIAFPFAPDALEAFSGETPVCVYLIPDRT